MTTLAEFLLARIAEDEALSDRCYMVGIGGHALETLQKRIEDECAAKRRIVAMSVDAWSAADTINGIEFPAGMELREARERSGYNQAAFALSQVLPELARPYRDHPGFDASWDLEEQG